MFNDVLISVCLPCPLSFLLHPRACLHLHLIHPVILDSHFKCFFRELCLKPWTNLDVPAVFSHDSLCLPFCNIHHACNYLSSIDLPLWAEAYTRDGWGAAVLCSSGCSAIRRCTSKWLIAFQILKRKWNWNQPICPSTGEWVSSDIHMLENN